MKYVGIALFMLLFIIVLFSGCVSDSNHNIKINTINNNSNESVNFDKIYQFILNYTYRPDNTENDKWYNYFKDNYENKTVIWVGEVEQFQNGYKDEVMESQEKYIGHGEIYSIQESLLVLFRVSSDSKSLGAIDVFVLFKDVDKTKLLNLKPNDRIKFKAKIPYFRLFDQDAHSPVFFFLTNGEIVN
jgi:hypothetical protein